MRDLTAILIPMGQVPVEAIERLVLARGYGDVYLRIAPLQAINLVQIEVCDAGEGKPTVDPELVAQLSIGGKSAFVHVNHYVKQALVHPFANGAPQESFVGEPGQGFEAALRGVFGHELAAITAADDGTWRGFGLTASRTRIFIDGVPPRDVPSGFPTGLDSFRFHDRGGGLPAARDRMAIFGFDRRAADEVLSQPGAKIAEWLQLRPRALGPLGGLLPEVVAELSALGERSPKDARCSVHALELVALACGRVFATGEDVAFWNDRVLPLLSLSVAPPQIEADEVEDLAETKSLWHAIVEVVPFAAPGSGEGKLVSQIGDDEIGPLSPWYEPGSEYDGLVFVLDPTRLLTQMRQITRETLEELEQKFLVAWFEALGKPGEFEPWAQQRLIAGEEDQGRVLGTLAELRTVLELSVGYQLHPAVVFYEVAT